jgi:type II secretory pathway pseudopilin PulG
MARRRDFRSGPPCRWGRDGRAPRLRHPAADEGFTIIESVVALGIIFMVLTGLLGTLGSATKGIVTARQRNSAVGLANQVLETARASSFANVGLNSADSTLATDPAIVAGAYDPDGGGAGAAEPLAYSSPSNQSPWPLHKFPTVVSGTTYQTYVYVTTVTPSGADPYKRVTAVVDWSGSGRAQYASTAIAASVKLSSFFFNASLPADPLLEGIASATGGTISVSGTIDNLAIADVTLALPQASSSLSSQFIQEADALAESASADLSGDLSLYASGANASLVTSTHASSPPVKVASSADNDAGTSAPENSSTTSSDAGGTVGRTNTVDLVKGASSSLYAKSTARSTAAGAIGDADALPYSTSDAAGPASFSMPYSISSLVGSANFGSVITTGASHVNTVLDRDTAGSQKQLLGTASVDHPATTLFTFTPSVLNLLGFLLPTFNGFVRIAQTGTITATANSGQGVSAPAISGGSFEVCVYDTLSNPLGSGGCPGGYKRLVVTPGTAGSLTAAAAVRILGATVSLSATVTSGTKSVTSTLSGTDYERADARLANWLKVVVDFSISTGTNLHVELDYGQIAARARYCLPTDAACIQAAL